MSENEKSLKERREAVGLTQQALADLALVRRTLIADMESGRQGLTGESAREVLKQLESVEANFRWKNAKEMVISTRIETGQSQEEVAKRAKIDLSEYAKWESGIIKNVEHDVFNRIYDAVNEIANEKSKDNETGISFAEPRSRLLSYLGAPVKRDRVIENWESYEKKEANRVVTALTWRSLNEEFQLLSAEADKVPGLESENAKLKAQVAELQKTIETLKSESGQHRKKGK